MASPLHQQDRPPARGRKTARVWAIADEISRRTGRKAVRADVIAQVVAEGGNAGTASTQYNRWSKQYRHGVGDRQTGKSLGPIPLQIKDAGRIVLTAELRSAMGVTEGDTILAKVSNGELRLYRRDQAIRALQARARELVAPGTLVSEELVEERKREAARE